LADTTVGDARDAGLSPFSARCQLKPFFLNPGGRTSASLLEEQKGIFSF